MEIGFCMEKDIISINNMDLYAYMMLYRDEENAEEKSYLKKYS
jgi:hypothetical protein